MFLKQISEGKHINCKLVCIRHQNLKHLALISEAQHGSKQRMRAAELPVEQPLLLAQGREGAGSPCWKPLVPVEWMEVAQGTQHWS